MPNPTVHLDTGSAGDIKLELYADEMPVTVANFLDLCATGFYEQLRWHECRPGFMVATGCPHTRQSRQNAQLVGCGGPTPGTKFQVNGVEHVRDAHGCIPDEKSPRDAKFSNTKYTVAMCSCGPNTRGSQFFINLGDNEFLDWWDNGSPDACHVFGRVVAGHTSVTSDLNSSMLYHATARG